MSYVAGSAVAIKGEGASLWVPLLVLVVTSIAWFFAKMVTSWLTVLEGAAWLLLLAVPFGLVGMLAHHYPDWVVRTAEVGDRVLFSPEDRYEVEVGGADYIMLRERDIHAVAASRIEASTGLYI